MFRGCSYALASLAVATLLALPAVGQSVISTHSGVIHFFEGAVYLGDQPLESHPGRFSSVPPGVELRTGEGRAEVLLTPGVFVRIGERSAIRMIANALSNTRVELLAGSAVVDSAEPTSGTSVTLLYKSWSVHSPGSSRYRIDSDPPQLQVFEGETEVSDNTHALLVKQGMYVAFAPVLVPERSIGQPLDALSNWVEGRQQSISADNAIAANIQDPASVTIANSAYDAYTQFPMLGLSSLGPSWSSPYNSSITYQPGFNSIYLPGYAYQPLLVGLYSGGVSTLPGVPYHPAVLPLTSRGPVLHPPSPLSPGRMPPILRPAPPSFARPVPVPPVSSHPIPVHPGSGAGAHVGGHR